MVIGFLTLAGCGGGEGHAAARPMSAEIQNFVDQGNEAQRGGEYQVALDLYRQAMQLDPEHPIPQFGALMAAMAIGETALVDSLSKMLETTAPDLLAMLNPDGSMGGGMPANPHQGGMQGGMPGGAPPEGAPGQVEGLPAGHPVLYEIPSDSTLPDTSGVG